MSSGIFLIINDIGIKRRPDRQRRQVWFHPFRETIDVAPYLLAPVDIETLSPCVGTAFGGGEPTIRREDEFIGQDLLIGSQRQGAEKTTGHFLPKGGRPAVDE